jgi:hypothetical protein
VNVKKGNVPTTPWKNLGLKVQQIAADFCQAPNTNLTQHNPHGLDDHPKTIHYPHLLDMARDDGMDKHGIDWLLGCHLVGFQLKSWANCC